MYYSRRYNSWSKLLLKAIRQRCLAFWLVTVKKNTSLKNKTLSCDSLMQPRYLKKQNKKKTAPVTSKTFVYRSKEISFLCLISSSDYAQSLLIVLFVPLLQSPAGVSWKSERIFFFFFFDVASLANHCEADVAMKCCEAHLVRLEREWESLEE